jgi:UMF1 family MFS transporter
MSANAAAVSDPAPPGRPNRLGARGVRRRAVAAWCAYDWANSPYITLVATFVIATYFTQGVASTPEKGAAWWGWMMGGSAIVIALLSPVLGAIADRGGRRKPWLLALTFIIAGASFALWWSEPATTSWLGRRESGAVVLTLVFVAVSIIAFEISMAFYNAMLPSLVNASYLGRVSGWGWGLGYLGGLACLVVALFVFIQPAAPPFGLDKGSAEHVRAAGPLVAVWLVLFSLPLFLLTPDIAGERQPVGRAVREGLKQLADTVREVRRYREIVRFLIARLLFMEGINTLFTFGGIFAAAVFGLAPEEIILFGILLNVTAAAGAFGFAWMDDLIGSKPTVLVGVFAIGALGVPLLLITSTLWFWILGASIGLFFGPVQAAARSLMARMAPPDKETEMFGLFTLSGKAISFLGPITVATVIDLTGDQRLGMATVLPYIIIGGILLFTVKAPPQPRGAGERA